MKSLAISFDDVRDAVGRIAGIATVTPVQTSRWLNEQTGCEVFVKCENFQRTGSFKFRGAYNAISRLTPDQRGHGVVAFSSGNHAQAVALAARLLSVPATIVMPTDAPEVKVQATREYGATIVRFDRLTQNREDIARGLAGDSGATIIPPFDHPHVMAGQGTLMVEWLEQVRVLSGTGLDAVVIPVGGGGLIAGCAIAAKGIDPDIHVIGVEPEGADDTRQSLEKGEQVSISPPTTIADGIRTPRPGNLTFPIEQALVDDVVLVTEADIWRALSVLILRMKLVSEPTGAVALAALMAGRIPKSFRRVGVLLCGGNVEPELLAQV